MNHLKQQWNKLNQHSAMMISKHTHTHSGKKSKTTEKQWLTGEFHWKEMTSIRPDEDKTNNVNTRTTTLSWIFEIPQHNTAIYWQKVGKYANNGQKTTQNISPLRSDRDIGTYLRFNRKSQDYVLKFINSTDRTKTAPNKF